MIPIFTPQHSERISAALTSVFTIITLTLESAMVCLIVLTFCCTLDLLSALMMNARYHKAMKSKKKMSIKTKGLDDFVFELIFIYIIILLLGVVSAMCTHYLGINAFITVPVATSIICGSKAVSCLRNYATMNNTKWALILAKYIDTKIDKLVSSEEIERIEEEVEEEIKEEEE